MSASTELEPFDDGSEYEDDGTPRPWSVQPGEDALAFAYFVTYRNMNPVDRSAAAVSRALDVKVSIIRELAAKFSWSERALSYDAYVDNKASEELARGRIQMKKQHIEIAEIAKAKILEGLTKIRADEMSARDLATWYDLAVKVERQARGEPDKVTHIEGELSVIDNLDTAARRALMAEAMNALAERLGPAQPALEGIVDADVVSEDGE